MIELVLKVGGILAWLTVVAWIYRLTYRQQIIEDHNKLAAEHAMRAAQDAHRLLAIVRGLVAQPVRYEEPAPELEPVAGPEELPTEPQPIVQPDTVPSHEAVTVQAVIDTGPRAQDDGRIADIELAHVLADMDNFVIDMEKRDAERKARAA